MRAGAAGCSPQPPLTVRPPPRPWPPCDPPCFPACSVVNQVYMCIAYDWFEIATLRRWPDTEPLFSVRANAQGRLVKVPSRLLMALMRTTIMALETFVAVSLPFFTSICGLASPGGLCWGMPGRACDAKCCWSARPA